AAAVADGISVTANAADGVSFGQGGSSIVGWIVRVAAPSPSGMVRVAAPSATFAGAGFVEPFVVRLAVPGVGVTSTAAAAGAGEVGAGAGGRAGVGRGFGGCRRARRGRRLARGGGLG